MIEVRGDDLIMTEGCECGGDCKLVDLRRYEAEFYVYEERKWKCYTCDQVSEAYHEVWPGHNVLRCLPDNKGICAGLGDKP